MALLVWTAFSLCWDHSGMRRKRKDPGWIWEGAGLEGGVDMASPALLRCWNGCLVVHRAPPSPITLLAGLFWAHSTQ